MKIIALVLVLLSIIASGCMTYSDTGNDTVKIVPAGKVLSVGYMPNGSFDGDTKKTIVTTEEHIIFIEDYQEIAVGSQVEYVQYSTSDQLYLRVIGSNILLRVSENKVANQQSYQEQSGEQPNGGENDPGMLYWYWPLFGFR